MIKQFIFGSLMAVGCFGCAVGPRSDGADKLASPRRVFLVRHAERFADGEDPALTAAGEARAQMLATTLREAGITTIITTQWRRTRDTAKPLAAQLRITPEVIPVFEGKVNENIQEVMKALRRHKDETVLVIGHITVTGVIAALGGPRLPTICETVFSDLVLFTPADPDHGLLHLRYGAAEDISPSCQLTRPSKGE